MLGVVCKAPPIPIGGILEMSSLSIFPSLSKRGEVDLGGDQVLVDVTVHVAH